MDKSLFKQTITNTFYIFAFGVFAGCICLNILWRVRDVFFRNEWTFALNRMNAYVSRLPYFLDIKVGLWFLAFLGIIFLLGFWRYGKVIIQGIALSLGFSVGGIETIWLLSFNMQEGLRFMLKLTSKMIVPATLGTIMLILAIMMSESSLRRVKKYIFYTLMVLIFYLVYLFLPSYVNFL